MTRSSTSRVHTHSARSRAVQPNRARRSKKESTHPKSNVKGDGRKAHAQIAAPVITAGSTPVPLFASAGELGSKVKGAWDGWMKGVSAAIADDQTPDAPYASVREFLSKLEELAQLDKEITNSSSSSSEKRKKKKQRAALAKRLENESFGGRPLEKSKNLPRQELPREVKYINEKLPIEVKYFNDEIREGRFGRPIDSGPPTLQEQEEFRAQGLRFWLVDQLLSSQNHLHGLIDRWANEEEARPDLAMQISEEFQRLNGHKERYDELVSRLEEKFHPPDIDFEKLNELVRVVIGDGSAQP